MRQLKEQRLSPACKFVLEIIKGMKAREPDKFGNVEWFDKDGKWILAQNFKYGCLWVMGYWVFLIKGYGLNNEEIKQLLTRLLHKYTNNGILKIKLAGT